jgi:hypothetical protein
LVRAFEFKRIEFSFNATHITLADLGMDKSAELQGVQWGLSIQKIYRWTDTQKMA